MVRIPDPSSRRSFSFRDTLQDFLLQGDLVFAQLLERDIVQRVFEKYGACFGGVFHTAIVLWAFMSQVLQDGKEASCQSAIARVSSYLARFGMRVPDSNTGDYCKARAKLSEAALRLGRK